MARKYYGACAKPKLVRTGVDCRAARPKFDRSAWSPAKISDVTGGGLYLFVTPDESRPGNAASKLWRMGYRFHSRQKTYSNQIGLSHRLEYRSRGRPNLAARLAPRGDIECHRTSNIHLGGAKADIPASFVDLNDRDTISQMPSQHRIDAVIGCRDPGCANLVYFIFCSFDDLRETCLFPDRVVPASIIRVRRSVVNHHGHNKADPGQNCCQHRQRSQPRQE